MGWGCGRLAFLWNCGKVKNYRAEDHGDKDASDFRDSFYERILSPGQGEIRLVHDFFK